MVDIYRNTTSFWATFSYSSGAFNGFYLTASEAIEHCNNPDNGSEFKGKWFQDRMIGFIPQGCVRVGDVVYSSGTNDRISHFKAIPCEWELIQVC
ncbi:MAG TPA: hypothetical protein V6D21_23545 [Candidatus Obscuribacterales bacterium]